ncbi:MAG: tol-pal system protein YbgF [Gammaproteobacteria bacterium]|nr:tol-pal system protein YbgF [Gammaproteobacteria bacterium]
MMSHKTIMQTAKIHIWLIGVVLAVAPIFYATPVQAQSGQQANMVLELQQLRAEMAELRDLLERQQYQIRQLQRGSGAAASPSRSEPSFSAPPSQPTYNAPASGAPVGVPEVTERPAPAPGTENGSLVPYSDGQQQAASANAGVPASPPAQGEEEFYRPYEGDRTIVDENPEVVSAARQARQANDTYPPVVDRSIGGQGDVNNAGGETAPGSANTWVSTEPPQVVNQAPVESANQAPATEAPRQVITPGQVAAQSNLPAPTPQAPSGGVIQIPSNTAPAAQAPNVAQSAPAAVAPAAVAVLSEDVLYQQGFDLLKQFKYDDAVDVFKQQIEQYPEGGFADDAHYWVAESMYLNRNLPESKQYFRAIIDNFSQSPRVPDAMLKTAYIEQDQGNEIEARILLQEIIQYHPRSDAAISAKNRLEKLN